MNNKETKKLQSTPNDSVENLLTEINEQESTQLVGGGSPSIWEWTRDNARGWGWAIDPYAGKYN